MTNRNKKDVHKHAVKYVDNIIIKGYCDEKLDTCSLDGAVLDTMVTICTTQI
jgi:hypothetical protein